MPRGWESWPRLGPATPSLQTSFEGGFALQTSITAPPFTLVVTGTTPFGSVTVETGCSMPLTPAVGGGGLVGLSALHIVLLPPALVAVTLHWMSAADDTSASVSVISLLVEAVVIGERSGSLRMYHWYV